MHEYGLFKLLIPALRKYLEDNSIKRITRLKLKIGERKGVIPEHLEHAFEHLQEEYPKFKGATLEYEIVGVSFRCPECGYTFAEMSATCPECGASFPEMATGDEFEVDGIEFA